MSVHRSGSGRRLGLLVVLVMGALGLSLLLTAALVVSRDDHARGYVTVAQIKERLEAAGYHLAAGHSSNLTVGVEFDQNTDEYTDGFTIALTGDATDAPASVMIRARRGTAVLNSDGYAAIHAGLSAFSIEAASDLGMVVLPDGFVFSKNGVFWKDYEFVKVTYSVWADSVLVSVRPN